MKNNGINGRARIEFLKQKQREIGAALASEHVKAMKHERRETAKLDSILGGAVRKTGADSPDFRLMISQRALSSITDDKTRRLLAGKGWL